MNEKIDIKPNAFNLKVRQVLKYVGTIMAIISAIVYVVLVSVFVMGINKVVVPKKQLLIFLILGATAGVSIGTSLRIQGVDFAKNEIESQEAIKAYKQALGKTKKKRKPLPIWAYQLLKLLQDIVIKGVGVVVSLYFMITLIVKGMREFSYVLTAIANVLFFTGLGMVNMSRSYDYYIEKEIPRLKRKTKELLEIKELMKEMRKESENDDEVKTTTVCEQGAITDPNRLLDGVGDSNGNS